MKTYSSFRLLNCLRTSSNVNEKFVSNYLGKCLIKKIELTQYMTNNQQECHLFAVYLPFSFSFTRSTLSHIILIILFHSFE